MDSINTQPTPQTQHILKGLLSLSRWKEQLPLATLTILGGLIAHGVYNTTLDWRLFAVAIANFLTVTFAFMINDMEDAEDDAASPVSAKRNPITNGTLELTTAWLACGVVVLIALGLFALGGLPVLIVGVFNLILSFLYSWKPVRLKSSTIGLDVVSHTLMLGGLLPLTGYLIYSSQPSTTIIFVVIATTLGSTYGQLYNQLRDFDADKKSRYYECDDSCRQAQCPYFDVWGNCRHDCVWIRRHLTNVISGLVAIGHRHRHRYRAGIQLFCP